MEVAPVSHPHAPARARRRRGTSRGSGSRLTIRNASRGKSKKKPGCTTMPSRSRRSSDELLPRRAWPESRRTADQPPSACRTSTAGRAATACRERRVIRSYALEHLPRGPRRPRSGRARPPAPASTPTDTCRRSARAAPAPRRRAAPDRRPRSSRASPAAAPPTSTVRRAGTSARPAAAAPAAS